MMLGFAVAITFAAPFVVFGSPLWVLEPLDRAARNRRFPVQFSLADLLCLFALVQLPLGVAHWVIGGPSINQSVLPVDLGIVMLATTVWWSGVRTLSRAGIHATWQRCMALTLAIPVGFAGGFGLVALHVVGLIRVASEKNPAGYWLLFAEVPLGSVIYGLGRFTRAIVAAAEARRFQPYPPAKKEGTESRPDVLRVNRPRDSDVVGAGDDGAGVGKDG
jgi:hypothetical protein